MLTHMILAFDEVGVVIMMQAGICFQWSCLPQTTCSKPAVQSQQCNLMTQLH